MEHLNGVSSVVVFTDFGFIVGGVFVAGLVRVVDM